MFGLGGTSSSLRKARRSQLRAIDRAQEAREETAGVIEGHTGEYVDESMAMFEPFMDMLGEGVDIMQMFTDPSRFEEALDSFYSNPQYKVMMENTTKAMERTQARSGDRYSGSQLAALSTHVQEQSNLHYGDFMDRQLGIARDKVGVGQFAQQGTQGVRDTQLAMQTEVAGMRDRSQMHLEKGAVRAGYHTAQAQRSSNRMGALASIAGMGVGGAMAGPLGGMIGNKLGLGTAA